jgi:CheY-like chemotaxis protein
MGILDDLKIVTQPDRVRENKKSMSAPFTIAERTVTSLSKWLNEQSFAVHLSCDKDSYQTVEINIGAFRQVITNLVKNAALHSQGTDVWVSLTGSREGGLLQLILRVEDNGRGIPETQRGKIFDAFGRGDTTADGTGLGLYIIKELCEMLAGDIEYFDSDRGGAGFRLSCTLPIASKTEGHENKAGSTQNLLSGKKILFAEDQLTLQALTQSLLIRQGAEPTVANNGVEALKLFTKQNFDIVLTDAMMPEMDGYTLSRELRKKGFIGPIIAVTAAVIGQETENLLASGVDIVMTKPIDIKLLNAHLESLSIQ